MSRPFLVRLLAAIPLCWCVLALPPKVAAQDVPAEEPGQPLGWNFKNLSPEQQRRTLRFSTFVNKGVPESYLNAENTVGYTTRAIAEGGPLYLSHCAKCHGESGLGNGQLAYVLTPSPALLAYMIQQPIAIDQYLLWTISEGGKQFDTAMPAFKSELSQEQIWEIVAYLRAGFPAVEDENAPTKREATPPAKTDEPSLKPKAEAGGWCLGVAAKAWSNLPASAGGRKIKMAMPQMKPANTSMTYTCAGDRMTTTQPMPKNTTMTTSYARVP